MTKKFIIGKVFYDSEIGFGSIQLTLKEAQNIDPDITLNDANRSTGVLFRARGLLF